MKKLIAAAAATLCVSFAQGALAEGLNALPYSGVEVSLTETSYDDIPRDGNGFGLEGSLAIGGNVFLTGSYESTNLDFHLLGTRGSIKASAVSAGIGYHYAMSPVMDLVPKVAVIDATTSFDGILAGTPDEDDTGWSGSVSLRALVTPQVELEGGVTYVSLYDDSGTSYQAQAYYYPVRNFGLGLTYDTSDDADTLGISARVLFGR